jgi:tRNA/rRNA methyltransferase
LEIIFILTEPAVPENIGASARAIKTMGFTGLRMINPQGLDSKKVKIVAHASEDILDNSEVFQTFEEAIQDLDFLVATSAKKRRTNQDYLHASGLPSFLEERKKSILKTGIIFGREESGLTNEEIRKCDLVTFIPLHNPYPSLNLSHAVMIYAYLLSGLAKSDKKTIKRIPKENIKTLKNKVLHILEDMEMKQLHIIGPRISERLSYLTSDDISLLHSICNAYLIRKDK